jgi:hypothetical protein
MEKKITDFVSTALELIRDKNKITRELYKTY